MTNAAFTATALDGIPTVQTGADLAAIILTALDATKIALQQGDVLIVAQKIVSKAEGRRVLLQDVEPSAEALELAERSEKDPRLVELILRESVSVLRCRPGLVVVKHRCGYVLANAGIDASNVEGDDMVLLLPVDSDKSAARLQAALAERCGVAPGIVINDSFGRAWRVGTVGTAIGVAGLPAVIDLRGQPDRNGRPLRVSELGVADEIAAAGSLLMGQGDEGRPVVHVRGLPFPVGNGRAANLVRRQDLDLFR